MKLTTTNLVREIKTRSQGTLTSRDIADTIKLLEEVMVDELKAGNSIKFRSLFNIDTLDVEEAKAYDGLNKRYYVKKAHKRVIIKPLSKLRNINED